MTETVCLCASLIYLAKKKKERNLSISTAHGNGWQPKWDTIAMRRWLLTNTQQKRGSQAGMMEVGFFPCFRMLPFVKSVPSEEL